MQIAALPAGRQRRTHSREFKARVVEACRQPGVSLSAIAMANGINANLARRWLLAARTQSDMVGAVIASGKSSLASAEFVPLQISAAGSASSSATDIRVEVQRGVNTVKVFWPAREAASCAAWLRDWLK